MTVKLITQRQLWAKQLKSGNVSLFRMFLVLSIHSQLMLTYKSVLTKCVTVGWSEFNVTFEHKYGYIRDERSEVESYPYPVKEG